MQKKYGNIGGIILTLGVPFGWVLSLAALPSDLKELGMMIDVMINDPLVMGAFIVGVGVFGFTNIPKLRFWEGSENLSAATQPSQRNGMDMVSPLGLSVSEEPPYMGTDGSIYVFRRVLKIKIENLDRSMNVANCKIQIIEAEPSVAPDFAPWPLVEGISLAAGDHIFIPLVSFSEPREPEKNPSYGDSFAVIENEDGRPYIDRNEPTTLTLRATAPGISYVDLKCRIWVENGRLRIREER